MRRKDREITKQEEIYEMMKKCDCCSVAFFDKEYPYIVPMNFGVIYKDGSFELYFHCAKSGTKLDLLQENDHVAFEMNSSHKLLLGETACDSTMEYESVCGNGTMTIASEDEKVSALEVIMNHYDGQEQYNFDERSVAAIHIMKLTVNSISGKRLKR